MSFLNFRRFARQTVALSHKNFLVIVVRNPIGFLLWTYGLPLAILAILANIPTWLSSSSTYGVASPAPIREFTVESGKKLAIVKKKGLGPDIDRVINTITKGIDPSIVHHLETEPDLNTLCVADLRGHSDCYASITFWDSPETTIAPDLRMNVTDHHAWQYTIRTDPLGGEFDATKHNSGEETVLLPIRLAVNNAITNMTYRPEVFSFTQETQGQQDRQNREQNVATMAQIYPFAMFACYWIIIYRLVGYITSDRESGMAQLVDAMGGGTASAARVMSWLLTYNLACLPLFIGFGGLYWRVLFRTSDIGSLIGWQMLQGLAVNSAAVFAAAFFTKSRVSAIYVIGAFLLVSVGAQVNSFQLVPTLPLDNGVYPLVALFASSNFVFFLQQMSLWEINGQPAQFSVLPRPADGLNSYSYGVTQSYMLIFLAINIVVYPILAMLVERFMHGIDFRHRTFGVAKQNTATTVVAETSDLKKRFTPSFLRKAFCSRRGAVTAVDGVSLEGHKGQILCLVGPNGSGKTTTLHMMAGFISPTGGSVRLAAKPSQIGICPQRNTMWASLTVEEHLNIWSKIKGHERAQDLQDLPELIADCDLTQKSRSLAKTLSGGQMRKLQLACMFVGDPSVCLIDECTSGLDPLSRRAIWDILLQQRSKRSILFTTHFLDEVDVLADHIVILSKGKVRYQGTPAELKMQHGSGYQLTVPRDSPHLDVPYRATEHQDSLVYSTPDSRSTAELLSQFTAVGVKNAAVAGPQVEDVFLNVADEPELTDEFTSHEAGAKMTPGSIVSFWAQVGILLRKRFTVLKRFWWPYLYVLALPLIITPQFSKLLKDYEQPTCVPPPPDFLPPYPEGFYFSSECVGHGGYGCDTITIGPQSAQKDLTKLVDDGFFTVKQVDKNVTSEWEHLVTSQTEFVDYFDNEDNRLRTLGGIYQGSNAAQIAYMIDSPRGTTDQFMSLWSGMNSGVEIISSIATFATVTKYGDNIGTLYAVFFSLLHAIYPAAFVLYPAIEKDRKGRALQYANGVRRAPLWVAYALFDLVFVLILAISITVIMFVQIPSFSPMWVMLPVLLLYGIAAMLLGYVISHFITGPLKSFLAMMGVSVCMYVISAVAFGVGSSYADKAQLDSITLGLTFGLNLILPIGNVFRAALLVLNVLQVRCEDGHDTPVGSIYAFGSPILYLVIQVVVLLAIIIWIEGDLKLFRRNKTTKRDDEKSFTSRDNDVEAEVLRVERHDTDFLRALHVSKAFGANQAVSDVTLGLPEGDVTALIGPNGAGKSTLVNLIQAEIHADRGNVLLRGEDARSRAAKRHIGICPQYDALDLMSTREHLAFYARIKGVSPVRSNVDQLMATLNLTPHASTAAGKLSGGNKRKLSLAIALMGTPPVLVLDEPTSAMDAVAKRAFWRVIRSISPGRSVLLTTHSMEEADALATRAAIISKRILAVGTTHALRERYSNYYYVTLALESAPSSTAQEMEAVRSWVYDAMPSAQIERDMLGGQVRFTVDGRQNVADVINLIEDNKDALGVEYYSVGGPTLESVFLNVINENNVQEEDGRDGQFWHRLRHLRFRK